MKKTSAFAVLALCVLALASSQRQVQAQTIPFQIIGGGVGPNGLPLPGQDPREHWSVGLATALGFYEGDGEVQTFTATPQADGTITGLFGSPIPYRFVGPSGDVLACYYGRTEFGAKNPGTFQLVPVPKLGSGVYVAHFFAEFVPFQPDCTGKFQGVTGSWLMYATTEPFVLGSSDPVAYWWTGFGSLTLKKGR
jgi:hypothetical protein